MTGGAFSGPSMMWIRPLVAGISQINIIRLLTNFTGGKSCRHKQALNRNHKDFMSIFLTLEVCIIIGSDVKLVGQDKVINMRH